MMQRNRTTSEIFLGVGLDPDAGDVIPLHRIGHEGRRRSQPGIDTSGWFAVI